MSIIHSIGRRKSSVARVFFSKGKGKITVNRREFSEYFPVLALQSKVRYPFDVTDTNKQFDVTVLVSGGGSTGQAEAIQLGIARSLLQVDKGYREQLKPAGLLSRDPRVVERKKYGRKKARKKFQFSKR